MTRDAVLLEVTIEASAGRVWQALTAGREAWWPELVFDAAVGSPLVETWWEDGRRATAHGTVTRCEPRARLAFAWRQAMWRADLHVDIRLASAGAPAGFTEVTLAETGFSTAGTGQSLVDEHDAGWRYHLTRLKRASEGLPLAP